MKRCWATKRRGFRATRLTVGASNDLQMEQNLTDGLPVIHQDHTSTLGPLRERFFLLMKQDLEGAAGVCESERARDGQRTELGDLVKCKF